MEIWRTFVKTLLFPQSWTTIALNKQTLLLPEFPTTCKQANTPRPRKHQRQAILVVTRKPPTCELLPSLWIRVNLPSFRAPSWPWLQPTSSPGGLHMSVVSLCLPESLAVDAFWGGVCLLVCTWLETPEGVFACLVRLWSTISETVWAETSTQSMRILTARWPGLALVLSLSSMWPTYW